MRAQAQSWAMSNVLNAWNVVKQLIWTRMVQYRVPRSNPNVKERLNLTNKQLRSAAGTIGLVVDRKCKELIKDFEQVCYKADSTQIDKDRDRKRTHVSDALGYLLWQECKPSASIGERRERLI
jgi:hypothetical protein